MGLRLNWQATKRNQFTGDFISDFNCNCFSGIQSGTGAPEEVTEHTYAPNYHLQATWTDTVNSKLVLWAGFTNVRGSVNEGPSGSTPTSFYINDATAGFSYGSGNPYAHFPFLFTNENFTASYVTGAHSFKFGYTDFYGEGSQVNTYDNKVGANGMPYGVTVTMACQAISPVPGQSLIINPVNGLPTTSYMLAGKLMAAPQIAATTVNSLACPSGQALLPSTLTQNLAPFNFFVG